MSRGTSRMRLIEAHQNRSVDNGRSERFYQFSVNQLQEIRSTLVHHQYVSPLPGDVTLLSARPTLWEPLYQAVIREFTNTSESGIFSGDRNTRPGTKHYSAMAQTIRALLPFALKYIPALDIAIFSLLTMYYGRLRADAGLVSLARTSYVATLSEFGRYISKTRDGATETHHLRRALCCTSIALCCFEHLDEVATVGSGYRAHLNGALQLLQSCGPAMARELPSFRLLLKGFRTIALHNSIKCRRSTFLSEQDWNHNIFGEADATIQDQLITMAMRLPGLLESVDSLQMSSRNSLVSPDIAPTLFRQIQSLRHELQSWSERFESTIEGDLFWPSSQPGIGSLRFVDPECIPERWSNLQQLTFASGTIAGLLSHYWCFELNLLSAEAIAQRFLTAEDKDTRNSSLTSQADKSVQHILEAQPYLTTCLEGTICMQLVMDTVKGYFGQPCN
jgi:hypothetical protein